MTPSPLDPQLLDELARIFARAALDALLREAETPQAEDRHEEQEATGGSR